MKIAVIGGGGREHLLVKRLLQSRRCGRVIAIPGNAGISAEVECVPIRQTDIGRVVDFCLAAGVDYVVASSTPPLILGLVDALEEAGIPAFGPSWAAARLEGSRVFAKNLMRRQGIPTAPFRWFEDAGTALAYVKALEQWPVVVRPDGPALGRGHFVCHSPGEAVAAVQALMVERTCGNAGERLVVEAPPTGEVVSVMAFCDGQRVLPLPAVRELAATRDALGCPHRVSLGALAPHAAYTPEMARRCMSEIYLPTVQALAANAARFTGCIHFNLALTPGGPVVAEYRCRFGDPEVAAALPLAAGDLLEVMMACTDGGLEPDMLRPLPGAAACLEVTCAGYPGPAFTGLPVLGLDEDGGLAGVQVLHHGTRYRDGTLVTGGGRVLTLATTAPTPGAAVEKLYAAAGQVKFSGAKCSPALAQAAGLPGR